MSLTVVLFELASNRIIKDKKEVFKTKMKTKIFSYLVIATMIFSAIVVSNVSAQEEVLPTAVEDINLLAPNTNPARNQWSALMAEELPKIGFNVEYENVGWDIIAPRTFANPAEDGTIPTADNKGYDLLFVGLSGSLVYDPTYSYANTQFSPSGDNFAHYDNQEVTDLITQYTSTPTTEGRLPIAKDIQAVIAEEIPYIPLMNTFGLWAFDDALDTQFTDADWLLISTTSVSDGWKDYSTADGSMVYAHTYALEEFTPFIVSSYIAAQYLSPVMPGLFERDPTDANFARQPLIAKAMPTWDAENKVATVILKDGVTFSNGNALTSSDVVNSYQMAMTPAVGSTSYASLVSFLDTKTYGNDSVVAINDTAVEFRFTNPYFEADSIMNLAIYDEEVIGTITAPLGPSGNEYGFNFIEYSIGAGPFKFESASAADGNVKLVKVANYWNGAVKLNSIEFNKYGDKAAALADLEGGKVDIIDAQAYVDKAEVEGKTGIAYTVFADFGTQMMSINMDHPVFGTGVNTPLGKADSTKAAEAANYVRLAISHATPRDHMVDEIVKGLGTVGTSLWPDKAEGYDNTLKAHAYDIELAKEYMEKAGYNIVIPAGTLPIDLSIFLVGIFSIGLVMTFRRRR